MREVITALDEALKRNESVAMATVVEVTGASPAEIALAILAEVVQVRYGAVGPLSRSKGQA